MAQMNTQLAGHTAAIKAMGPAIEFLGKRAGFGAETPKFPIASMGDLFLYRNRLYAKCAREKKKARAEN